MNQAEHSDTGALQNQGNTEQIWLVWSPRGCLIHPSDIGMLRSSSHLVLKHWSSLFSFLWKKTVLLLQAPMARIAISPPFFLIPRDCSHRNISRTNQFCHVFTRVTSHLSPKPWGRLRVFLPMGKNCPASPGAMAEIGIPSLKFSIYKNGSQTKSAVIDKSGWPWPVDTLTCLPNTGAPCFPS